MRAGRLFRQEALDEHARTFDLEGAVLRIAPAWTSAAYWLVTAVAGAGLAFIALASVPRYAEGPAIVRVEGLEEVTAPFAATVTEVAVLPGQAVEAGDLLVSFYAAAEQAELERARREFDLRLVGFLRDPGDGAARALLAELRPGLEAAERALAARAVRAVSAGAVADVRVRRGQAILPGETLLAITRKGARPGLLAFLPGHHRPALLPGMTLRLELDGWPRAYQEASVETVSEPVVGPAEARRLLGPALADSLPLTGPVVLLRARLPAEGFRAGRRTLGYHDGMVGRAELRLERERLLFLLVPALRGALGSGP